MKLTKKELHWNKWYKIEFGMGILNSIKKYFRDRIYRDADDMWGRGTAHSWISSNLKLNNFTERDKIGWILYCITCDDDVMRYAVHIVVREEFPEYKKVLDNPGKYRLLL